jgi:hypothetical protein
VTVQAVVAMPDLKRDLAALHSGAGRTGSTDGSMSEEMVVRSETF